MSQNREAGSPLIEPNPPTQKADSDSTRRTLATLDAATSRTMRRTLATLDSDSTRRTLATLDAATSRTMRRTLATLDSDSTRRTLATLDAATSRTMRRTLATLDSDSTRRTLATLDAATSRTMRRTLATLDSDSTRRTLATLDAATSAWAALDYSKLAESWSTPDASVALHYRDASLPHQVLDAEATQWADEVSDLPAPRLDGASVHPALLLVLFAGSPALVDIASEGVLPILEVLLLSLRLLGVIASLDPAVPGALLLMTVVGMILTLLPKADRQ